MASKIISTHIEDNLGQLAVQHRLEGLVFANPRGISLKNAQEYLGLTSPKDILRLTQQINEENQRQGSVIYIAIEGDELIYRVQDALLDDPVVIQFTYGKALSDAEIKTLACIAYNQPIAQQDVIDLVGRGSKKALRELVKKNFIAFTREKMTVLDEQAEETTVKLKIYTTQPRFAEYFGIADDPEVIRDQIENYLG